MENRDGQVQAQVGGSGVGGESGFQELPRRRVLSVVDELLSAGSERLGIGCKFQHRSKGLYRLMGLPLLEEPFA